MAEFSLLTTLADEPRLSGIDVADRTGVSAQAAHAALTALERKGLVSRVAEVEHRRVVRTRLTDHGEKVLSSCLDELRDLGIEFAERLPPDKRTALIGLMAEYVEANRSDEA
jgi:DNA-binding MarR family transcriptional regulator